MQAKATVLEQRSHFFTFKAAECNDQIAPHLSTPMTSWPYRCMEGGLNQRLGVATCCNPATTVPDQRAQKHQNTRNKVENLYNKRKPILYIYGYKEHAYMLYISRVICKLHWQWDELVICMCCVSIEELYLLPKLRKTGVSDWILPPILYGPGNIHTFYVKVVSKWN